MIQPLTWTGHDREYTGARGKLDVAQVSRSYEGWYVYDLAEPGASLAHGPVKLLTEAQDWAERNL